MLLSRGVGVQAVTTVIGTTAEIFAGKDHPGFLLCFATLPVRTKQGLPGEKLKSFRSRIGNISRANRLTRLGLFERPPVREVLQCATFCIAGYT